MDEQPQNNNQNPKNFIHNPNILAMGIASILSAIVNHIEWFHPFQAIINTILPVVSMMLAYIIALLTAKLYTFTPVETQALARCNKRIKLIKATLKKENLAPEVREAYEKQLNQVFLEKIQIGKSDTKIDLD